MGARPFYETIMATSAEEAFATARANALEEHGDGGYSGSIAEKDCFVMIPMPALPEWERITPREYAELLIEAYDARIADKWGPAGCIEVRPGEYLFFGWSSN